MVEFLSTYIRHGHDESGFRLMPQLVLGCVVKKRVSPAKTQGFAGLFCLLGSIA